MEIKRSNLWKYTLSALFFLLINSSVFALNWEDSQWIWQTEDGPANEWMCYRKTFDITSVPSSALANIAANSKYWMWINDKLVIREGGVKRGPNRTDSWYDEVDIESYLKAGSNTIAILVWHWGSRDDHYYKSYNPTNKGGLVFLAKIGSLSIKSDDTWKMMVHPSYSNSSVATHRFKPEHNIKFDARNDIANWYTSSYNDASWSTPVQKGTPPIAPWGELHKRNIPQWKDSDLKTYTNNSSLNLPKAGTGGNITCNLPYNAQVYSYLKVNATAGKTIKISADNWDDNYVVEYVTKDGEQTFEVPSWNNGHKIYYNVPTGVTVMELKYRETEYDADITGSFTCNDAFYNTLWTKATRTLKVCMRDTYMDCPDRERALWWGDVVLQMNASFYALDRNADLLTVKCANDLIGWREADGALRSPIPFSVKNFEYAYQMLSTIGWGGFYSYYLYTGDSNFIADMYPYIREYMLRWSMGADGLPVNSRVYNKWIDWGTHRDVAVTEDALYYYACKAFVEMAGIVGSATDVTLFKNRMTSIEANFDKAYWKSNGYRSDVDEIDDGKPDDRANAMAIVAGLVDSSKYATVKDVLVNTKDASPYMEKFVEHALFLMGEEDAALTRMKSQYTGMVNNASTTLYEGWNVNSGTNNHAWNVPNLILSKYAIGVEPIAPGFSKYQVLPKEGSLKSLKAEIPSIKGLITVDISKTTDSYQIDLISPDNTVAVVGIPKKNMAITQITVNGNTVYSNNSYVDGVNGISWNGEDDSFVKFNVAPGTWKLAATGEAYAYLPGTLEIENYRLGGQGIGYSDNDAEDKLGQGRPGDGVDVGTIDGITYVGNTEDGEWLSYAIKVDKTETYDIWINYAAENSDGQISASLNDTPIFTEQTLPKTIDLNQFDSIKIATHLFNSGSGILKIKIDKGGFNLNKLFLVEPPIPQAPFSGNPFLAPCKIEAEDYDVGGEGVAYHDSDDINQSGEYRTDGVDIGTGGSGYTMGYSAVGEWLEYSIDVKEDAEFELSIYYASGRPGGGAKIGFSLPDTNVTLINSFDLPVTSGWSSYDTLGIGNVVLPKGLHVLRLNIVDRGFNLDWVEIIKVTDEVGINDLLAKTIKVYPNPSSSGQFHLSKYQKWEVYSLLGIKISFGEDMIIDLSNFEKGIYILKTTESNEKLLFK